MLTETTKVGAVAAARAIGSRGGCASNMAGSVLGMML
jgi:hypothetical protein